MDCRLPRGRSVCRRGCARFGLCAAARGDRRDAADDRLRGCRSALPGAAARRQHRHDSGGLGAYGPKLAQVALTFGADDIDSVSPEDDESQGGGVRLRRNPQEHQAAGFEPVERDGRFDRRAPIAMPIRLGAVSYLNTRPLVYGLEQQTERFDLRFDVPAKCAELLHANESISASFRRSSIPATITGSCPACRSHRTARWRRLRSSARCRRSDSLDRARHQLANVGGAAPRSLRALVRDRAAARQHAARSRRCSRNAMRRSSSATTRSLPITRRSVSRKSISAKSGPA